MNGDPDDMPHPPTPAGGDPYEPEESPPETGSDETRNRWAFLADASRHLAQSLDYEKTLETVVNLSLPHLGSWSIVDLTESDGSVRRLAVVHPEPEKQAIARELQEGWPPRRDDPIGIPVVARTGEPELVPVVTDELLVEVARSDENLRRLRALGITSIMTVPMTARGCVLGAITFVASSANRRFTKDELSLAMDLAHRCGLAIDNARLHRAASAATEAERARIRAEVANQVRGEFLATASHEMRTPLNAIAGYVELLAMEVAGPLTSRQREFVAAIDRGGQQLLSVVENMLNLVRLTSSEIQYEKKDFYLRRIVEDVTQTYRPALEDGGVDLEVICPDDLQAHADPPKVWQILLNLLSNSRKFTDEGGRVVVECESDAESGRTLIGVRDSGCGIPPDRLEAIFEPFTQADSSLSRTAEGMGLGLSIGRHLARDMGGDLTVETQTGDGCTFMLTLPGPGG